MNILVDFIHRTSKPINPSTGKFYWVDDVDGTHIWFSPDEDPEHLILLNGNSADELNTIISRIDSTDSEINELQEELEYVLNNLLGESDLPTKVSELENDLGYLTDSDLDDYVTRDEIPTKVSELENDLGYLTDSDLDDYVRKEDVGDYISDSDLDEYALKIDVPTKISELENDVDYLTDSDLDEYAKKSDIPEPSDLTDEQIDKIVEKVNKKTVTLNWQII